MVITCPNCSARYRLSPEKITGKGAKITCPKCAHVFVVFTEGAEAGPAQKVRPTPAQATPSSDRPRAPAPSPSMVGRDPDTTTGAFRAVGIAENEVGATSSNIRVVAPGSRTRRMSTLESGQVPIAKPEGESAAGTDDGDIKSAADLKFRDVGIKTWKVKVAIGLIYDFSDIATLKKYLLDKKVTADDFISHNSADWTRIGDIPDLDRHFIDVWKKAKEAFDRGEAPEPKKPTTTVSAPAIADKSAAPFRPTDTAAPKALTSTGRQPSQPRAEAKKSGKGKDEVEPANHRRTIALAVVAAALVVGIYFAWQSMQQLRKPAPQVVEVEKLGPSETELREIQEGIRKKLELEAANIGKAVGDAPAPETEDVAPEEAPRQLVPVLPSEQQTQPRKAPVLVERPQATPAPVADGGNNGSAAVMATKRGDPGKMYFDVGVRKLAEGNFGSAVMAFKSATQNSPKTREYWVKLAEAYRGLGNADEAAKAMQEAEKLNQPQSLANPSGP